MAEGQSSPTEKARLTIPKIRTGYTPCKNRGPLFICNRPAGHTGRHLFAWRNTDGRVRGVWGDQ